MSKLPKTEAQMLVNSVVLASSQMLNSANGRRQWSLIGFWKKKDEIRAYRYSQVRLIQIMINICKG